MNNDLLRFTYASCLHIYIKYQEEEDELKSWAEKKYEDNWRPFTLEKYENILDNLKETDPDWLAQFCDYLSKEGLSEKAIKVISRNSTAEFWPSGLSTSEKRAKNELVIKQLNMCKSYFSYFTFFKKNGLICLILFF
jgi:hypothetical protein